MYNYKASQAARRGKASRNNGEHSDNLKAFKETVWTVVIMTVMAIIIAFFSSCTPKYTVYFVTIEKPCQQENSDLIEVPDNYTLCSKCSNVYYSGSQWELDIDYCPKCGYNEQGYSTIEIGDGMWLDMDAYLDSFALMPEWQIDTSTIGLKCQHRSGMTTLLYCDPPQPDCNTCTCLDCGYSYKCY